MVPQCWLETNGKEGKKKLSSTWPAFCPTPLAHQFSPQTAIYRTSELLSGKNLDAEAKQSVRAFALRRGSRHHRFVPSHLLPRRANCTQRFRAGSSGRAKELLRWNLVAPSGTDYISLSLESIQSTERSSARYLSSLLKIIYMKVSSFPREQPRSPTSYISCCLSEKSRCAKSITLQTFTRGDSGSL